MADSELMTDIPPPPPCDPSCGPEEHIAGCPNQFMPDDLRTRIAAVIYDTVAWRSVNVPVAEEVADAVIRELVAGKAGVGEAGPELERRGALDQVPGNTWD